jgi:3-phosphoshikimate 1-carboxyvinyltransferase
MGAALYARRNDSLLPLTVVGRTPLRAIEHTTPVPSAQVKSAVLLAGLRAEGRTTVREAVATRDHTERMLRARGVDVRRESLVDGGVAWSLEGGVRVRAIDERVPADISAAAFWLVAGAIHPDAELTLRAVGVNPTRRGILDLLERMGARIEERPLGAPGGAEAVSAGTPAGTTGPGVARGSATSGVGEPLADLIVRSSQLRGIEVGPAEVAESIDEIPILCLAATQAQGRTTIRGAGELRHKESDRIAGIVAGLGALGARIVVDGDDLAIDGPTPLVGAATDSLHDHRLAMTFAVAGLIARGATTISAPSSASISYPGFFRELEGMRA